MSNSIAPSSSWTARGRVLVFLLAATSIACLLADFYRLCPMSFFTAFIFAPALLILLGLAVFDRTRCEGHVWRAVWIGLLGGLLAAVAYDVFSANRLNKRTTPLRRISSAGCIISAMARRSV